MIFKYREAPIMRKGKTISIIAGFLLIFKCHAAAAMNNPMPKDSTYTNSIDMKLMRIEAGSFRMGFEDKALPDELTTEKQLRPTGDFDEHPSHMVTIKQPFYMACVEVTNAQYELFDPNHKTWRGRRNLSKEDNEAVLFVSWYDAMRFCRWLSRKEGLPYRLATEAEWEYACRAGTSTPFNTGNALPEALTKKTGLLVGQSAPNTWGLHDMHGNVEEWCHDWYGEYESRPIFDPLGAEDGDFKVIRGGSHSTEDYYLRSANRSGSVPEDRQWLIGFRVVLGPLPAGEVLPRSTRSHQRYVRQNIPADIEKGPDPDKPYFVGPRLFVKIPKDAAGPLFGYHSHFTAITECPNGDLLAAWFNCFSETGRELGVAASRLRYGHNQWESASTFWDAPDRNDHAHTLWYDGKGTIFHFNGLAVTGRGMAMLLRKSRDSGATWSKARFIYPHHDTRTNFVIESVFRTQNGDILMPSDGRGGSVISLSSDEGKTWVDPGGSIRGIHAGVAQLRDGSLIAFGRKKAIEGKMPLSTSSDMGKSWQYSPSEFQPVNLGQRPVLMRLKEGPLFFASFCRNMMITDASGNEREISGLFTAVSTDEGKTWSHRRLVSDDSPAHDVHTMDGHPVTMDSHSSEFVGYLSVCQTADKLIHLISSRQHYTFNLKWLTTPAPQALPEAALTALDLPVKDRLVGIYKPEPLPSQSDWQWRHRGGKEAATATLTSEGRFKISTGPEQQCWWRSAKADGFDAVDQRTGFTVEIKTQILKTTSGRRGVDFELYDGAGSRYAMTITADGVYWYEGLVLGSAFLNFEEFVPIAEGLDNTDTMHTYRLAVRTDRIAQIYRDDEMIGLKRYEYRTPRDAYILFGAGHGVEALIDYVAHDLGGPSRP